ncbi:MAG: tetratricopeptide repeat protein, partial [Gemmobacter sp.]
MLIAVLSLSACQSSEEKAEDHYQSALRLLAANDEDRAIVEFRNVFQLNGFHKQARQDYAALMLKRGQVNDAYGQYLRLIEQYPDTLDARQTLAELAVGRNDWDEVARHGEAAIALAPDDPRNKTIATILAYQKAVVARDGEATKAVVDNARSLLRTRPDDMILRRIVLDSLVSSGDATAALAEVDRLLEQTPDSLEFNGVRLRLLNELGDQPGVGKQLRRLLALTPDSKDLQRATLQWHMSQKDMDGAEA